MYKDEIDIEKWEKFVANNEEIKEMLNRSAYDLSDIVADANFYLDNQESVNSLLDSLKKVNVSSRLSCGADLTTKIDSLVQMYDDSAVSVIFALEYAEKEILAYKTGDDIGQPAKDMFNNVMKGITDANVFWIVHELTSSDPLLHSFTGLLTYGTDSEYEGANFVVGDAAKAVAGELWPVLLEESENKPYKHAAVGGSAVMLFTAYKDYLLDEGDFKGKDILRTGIDAAGTGLNYANWVLVSGAFEGPLGVLLSSASTMAVAPMLDQVKDKIVGDNVIHTIEKGEDYDKDYKVPKNGNGKERTSDVIFERSKNANDTSYTLGDQKYSDYNYKSIMYRDWETLLPGGRGLYGDETVEQLNSYLEQIKNSNDPAIVKQYEERLDLANPQSLADDTARLYDVLKQEHFDLQEYYDYYHGGLKK